MTRASFRYTTRSVSLIARYAHDRMSSAAIAGLMNCSQTTVENICRKHEIRLVNIPNGAKPLDPYVAKRRGDMFIPVQVPIAAAALDRINLEASRRGAKPSTLIARLCEIVATDDLFSAVLDR